MKSPISNFMQKFATYLWWRHLRKLILLGIRATKYLWWRYIARVLAFSLRTVVRVLLAVKIFLNKFAIIDLVYLSTYLFEREYFREKFVRHPYISNFDQVNSSLSLRQIKFFCRKYSLNMPESVKRFANGVPRLCVIVTTFNQSEEQLRRSFNSIAEQERKIDEIIYFDGGSTNTETLSWLKWLDGQNFPNLKIFFEINEGIVVARNKAVSFSESNFITFLDPDDKFDPRHFVWIDSFIRQNPGVDLLYPDMTIIGDELEKPKYWYTGPFDFAQMLIHNRVPISSTFRKSFFIEIGGFREIMENGSEDWDLWLRMSIYAAKAVHVPTTTFIYSEGVQGGRTDLLALKVAEQERIMRQNAISEYLAFKNRHNSPA